ncbi:hypothetical protein F5Y19DRAFT_471960 [Xylariaceae sp. FL1651]|nr:hypothetical protein F5Y19DRAFT_471960 [Xylariaceae sp. FL1651]
MAFALAHISTCGRELFVTDSVFAVLCLVFLTLRFWAARRSRRKLYADDLFVVLSFANSVGLASVAAWATFNGLGMHIWELDETQLVIQVKLLLASELTYLMATTFVKLSVLWLYRRIYITAVFRRWCYGLMTLVILYLISFIPLYLTNCIPISQLWLLGPHTRCRDPAIGDNATIIVNLILDVAILVLPLPVLWRLRMSVRDKATVTAMFSIGIVTVAVMIWRLVVTIQTRSSPDWTRTLCQVGLISSLEVWLGIMAACIPTLGPLFNAYVKPILSKLGVVKTAPSSSDTGSKSERLETVGGSCSNRRPGLYNELYDSRDQIIAEDNSVILSPRSENKITAECAFKPVEGAPRSDPANGVIHVQREIEAVYHWERGEVC